MLVGLPLFGVKFLFILERSHRYRYRCCLRLARIQVSKPKKGKDGFTKRLYSYLGTLKRFYIKKVTLVNTTKCYLKDVIEPLPFKIYAKILDSFFLTYKIRWRSPRQQRRGGRKKPWSTNSGKVRTGTC